MEYELKFAKEEAVRKGTWICQVEDGTIFYWKYTSPKRLYVKWNGNEITAGLPEDEIYCKGAHGNASYLCSKEKIYKAVFSPSIGISVSYLRNQLEGEELHYGGLCSRQQEGKTYVYRMGEDPGREGVLLNIPEERLEQIELRALHRGKAIYIAKNSNSSNPRVTKLKENVIVIEMRYEFSFYALDSSPFLYIAGSDSLLVLDTITMEFLPPLRTKNLELHSIAGVHHGVITVDATMNGEVNLMTARLPEEYIENTVTVNGETITIEVLVQRYKETELLLKDVLEGNEEQKKKDNKEEEMSNKIKDLQKINSDLIKEKEIIKRVDEDMMTELKMSIKKLESKNFDLGQKMARFKNATEEKTTMIKTISELREEIVRLKGENDRTQQMRGEHLEMQRITAEFSHEKEVIQKANDEEKGKLQKKITELTQEVHRITKSSDVEIAEQQRQYGLLSQEKIMLMRKNDEEKAQLQRQNMELSLEKELLKKQNKEEKDELERQRTSFSSEKEQLHLQNDQAHAEIRRKYDGLLEERNQLKAANEEDIAELNHKIEELQEEITDLMQEKEALDNVEKARVELNMRRLQEKIHKLTEDNKIQTQHLKVENDELALIVELQKKNMEKEMKMTEELNLRQRRKDEERDMIILELRKRVHNLEDSRMHKVSVNADEEDDETNIHAFLSHLKQIDHSEEFNELTIDDERPSLASKLFTALPEPVKELSSPNVITSQSEVAQELSPIPNDPISPPPPPFNSPPLLSPDPTQSSSSVQLTSNALDNDRPSTETESSYATPLTSPAEARSNLITEYKTALKFREAALEQTRAGRFEVASIVRGSIRRRSKSVKRRPDSKDE